MIAKRSSGMSPDDVPFTSSVAYWAENNDVFGPVSVDFWDNYESLLLGSLYSTAKEASDSGEIRYDGSGLPFTIKDYIVGAITDDRMFFDIFVRRDSSRAYRFFRDFGLDDFITRMVEVLGEDNVNSLAVDYDSARKKSVVPGSSADPDTWSHSSNNRDYVTRPDPNLAKVVSGVHSEAHSMFNDDGIYPSSFFSNVYSIISRDEGLMRDYIAGSPENAVRVILRHSGRKLNNNLVILREVLSSIQRKDLLGIVSDSKVIRDYTRPYSDGNHNS